MISRPIGFLEKPQLVTKMKVDTSAFGKFNELSICLWLAFYKEVTQIQSYLVTCFMCSSLRLKNPFLNKVFLHQSEISYVDAYRGDSFVRTLILSWNAY